MSTRRVLPATVDDLINHLDQLYPDRCIGTDEPLEAAHRRAGQRSVVEYLRSLQAKETNAELERHKGF